MPLALRYMRLPIAFFVIAFFCGTAAAEVIATKSYSYFDIKGKTADELDDELSRRGPTANGSSARHPGATKIRFGGEATYIQDNGRCRVGNVKVTVHTQIIMPRWRNRKGASRELSMIWDALSSDIKRHEERHAEIARTQARAMERELKALRRTTAPPASLFTVQRRGGLAARPPACRMITARTPRPRT